jgi:hypothetical protein
MCVMDMYIAVGPSPEYDPSLPLDGQKTAKQVFGTCWSNAVLGTCWSNAVLGTCWSNAVLGTCWSNAVLGTCADGASGPRHFATAIELRVWIGRPIGLSATGPGAWVAQPLPTHLVGD